MKKNSKQYPNPKFSSLEEEDKYWETHSPLDEGYEGKVETSEQKRSSFLSVRMTGGELSQLRDKAAEMGIGPSTYARLILKNSINNSNWMITSLLDNLYNSTNDYDSPLKCPGIYVFDTNNINMKQDFYNVMLTMMSAAWKGRVVTPDDADYAKAKLFVGKQP